MAVEYFDGRRSCVCDGPVVYGSFRDEAEGVVVHPLPEHHVLVVHVRLDLLLRLQIRYLERAPAGLEGEDALVRVHDHAVGRDGSSEDIVRVGEVNDDDLVLLPDLLADSNEAVRLERQRLPETRQYIATSQMHSSHLEGDGGGLDAQARELQVLRELDRF